jgi:hypothetical protein
MYMVFKVAVTRNAITIVVSRLTEMRPHTRKRGEGLKREGREEGGEGGGQQRDDDTRKTSNSV